MPPVPVKIMPATIPLLYRRCGRCSCLYCGLRIGLSVSPQRWHRHVGGQDGRVPMEVWLVFAHRSTFRFHIILAHLNRCELWWRCGEIEPLLTRNGEGFRKICLQNSHGTLFFMFSLTRSTQVGSGCSVHLRRSKPPFVAPECVFSARRWPHIRKPRSRLLLISIAQQCETGASNSSRVMFSETVRRGRWFNPRSGVGVCAVGRDFEVMARSRLGEYLLGEIALVNRYTPVAAARNGRVRLTRSNGLQNSTSQSFTRMFSVAMKGAKLQDRTFSPVE